MKSGEIITQEQAEQFVVLWQLGKGTDVAKEMKLSRQRVHQLAGEFRLLGIPLRKRTLHRSYITTLDIEKLKKIAIGCLTVKEE